MLWNRLQPSLAAGSRVIVETRTNRSRRSWADDLLNSLGSVACYDNPLPAMDFMAQMIIEVPSLSALFDPLVLTEMCEMGPRLRSSLSSFDSLTPHRNIWHPANYLGCLSPEQRINCTYLTGDDIRRAERLVRFCAAYRQEILECRRGCLAQIRRNENENRPLAVVDCPLCDERLVSPNCSSQMIFDLFYRILPMDLDQKPLMLNSFLPIFTFASYRLQNVNVSLNDFLSLQKALSGLRFTHIKLKGFLLDIKRDILLDAAMSDSRYSLLAGLLVVAMVILYTGSPLYCLAVIWHLCCSVVMPTALYRLFTDEFPLLNLVVFVLLVSIGSDGAFLLYSSFPRELTEDGLFECLRHTASTMFLTQFSTIVPFIVNIFSAVLVFRSFGLFAALSLMVNYFLLITFLPSVLVIQRQFVDHLRLFDFSFFHPKISVQKFENFLYYWVPFMITRFRFIFVFVLSLWAIMGGYFTATQLHLPQYNPLQLFVGNNPHEFYDNNAERLFTFVEQKIALPLTLRLVWGIKGSDESSRFGSVENIRLQSDPNFHLNNSAEIRSLAAQLHRYRTLPFVQHPAKYWPERFVEWSVGLSCSRGGVCCNMDNVFYSDTYLDYCMRVSTAQLLTNYNDTPIYHNITLEMMGYTALLPTQLRYSHRFANLSHSFEQFEKFLSSDSMWYTTEWGLMSTWFDLQRSIISDSQQSVIVSLIVVLLFSASILRLVSVIFSEYFSFHSLSAILSIMGIVISTTGTLAFIGWEIGILEAVILVLVVGLSFDYTLHYGAALPSNGCSNHRLEMAVRTAGKPVTMAAATSAVSAIVLFMSQTHAFFQIAVFLFISTTYSILFATFFFLPLIYIFMRRENIQCDLCTNEQNSKALHLRELQT